MAQFDLPLAELREYAPALVEPWDLDAFWATTLAEARSHPLAASFMPVETGLTEISSHDVTFAGYGGSPVKGWLHLPAHGAGSLAAVVEYVGYGGGRGLAHERVLWAAAGYAHFVMDTRGQGSGWAAGTTPDPDDPGDPAHPGFMTRGILHPDRYYYRRLYTDAVRAVEAVRSHPRVDPTRVVGDRPEPGWGPQSRCGRARGRPAGRDARRSVPERLPAGGHARRHRSIRGDRPVSPGSPGPRRLRSPRPLPTSTWRSWADGRRPRRSSPSPSWTRPVRRQRSTPSYNAYGGPREIREYPFNNHEGGEGFHQVVQMRWLRELAG